MPATVTPVSGTLGNKETTSLTAYTVTPEAGSTVTQIVERINGVIVNTFNNPASLSRTLTAPNATWDTLAYFANHTASVTVTDSNGAQTVTTYSFAKTLGNSASLLEATKANTDAKNRISTKRDALAAQVGLSAGSTFDAISAQISGGAFLKWASGSTFATTSLVVTGLAFQPKVVMWTDSTSGEIYGLYNGFEDASGTIMSKYLSAVNRRLTQYPQHREKSEVSITSSGFSIPMSSGNREFIWWAIG